MDNNPFADRFVMIVSLLIAFGAPTARGIAFSVIQDPGQMMGVAILYGLTVLILSSWKNVFKAIYRPLRGF
jgi:hypothetical protein